MNLNLSPSLYSLYRSGTLQNPNLQPEKIRLGDKLTHIQTRRKVVVACVDPAHLLLVDADGHIVRMRTRKAANRYFRDLLDIHGVKNVEMAVRKAVSAYDNDRRILTKLGLRISQLTYLNNICRSIRH